MDAIRIVAEKSWHAFISEWTGVKFNGFSEVKDEGRPCRHFCQYKILFHGKGIFDMVDYWTFGNNVRNCRMKAGMTQEVLAEKADLSEKGIQKVEAGQSGVRMDTLVKLSVALKVSMDVLAGIQEEDKADRRRELFCRLVEDKTDAEAEFAVELACMVFLLKKKYLDKV